MFHSLPAETVFEAKARARRATFYLFILLAGLYLLFANLLALTASLSLALTHSSFRGPQSYFYDWKPVISVVSLAAILLAAFHFLYVRRKTLDAMLSQLQAQPADPRDAYHRRWIDLVGEAGAATGIGGIRPVVLETPGCNAFSLQDGKGNAAIGATEGLLSKLSPEELSAVVAHEAAHLVHEDSRLVSTACFLFSVFGQIHEALGEALSRGAYASRESRLPARSENLFFVIPALWLVSGLGYLITRVLSMAISREREYLADADGVAMCKDPFAMAEGLYRISRRFRGHISDNYSALFILNPSESGMDDLEGFFPDLFTTHPPLSQRLSKLVNWAKTDLTAIQGSAESEEKAPAGTGQTPLSAPPASFMAYQNNQWTGPYDPTQLLAMGFITPTTWVCPAGGREVVRAAERPELLPLFLDQVKGSIALETCPRCKVPLLQARYEGAEVEQCAFCKGYLLKAGVLERMIMREEAVFTPRSDPEGEGLEGPPTRPLERP